MNNTMNGTFAHYGRNILYKKVVLVIVLSLGFITALAQNQSRGIIVDSNDEPIFNATVSEMLPENSHVINMVLSDSLGKFKMNLKSNHSYLYVSCLGYQPQKVELNSRTVDLKIVLKNDSSLVLNEVVVSARRPTVRLKSDRIVYDLSTNPFKDDTALEMMKFVPLVSSNSESFSIIGKDYTEVYINGRKSRQSKEALVAYLKSLPAGNIKNIEVITAPNSTFRGEGNFGVINIELKANEDEGIKGLFSSQVWKTHFFKERGTLNLDYHKKKWSVNLSAGATNASDWKNNLVSTTYKQDPLFTSTNTLTDGNKITTFANLITSCQLADNQIIGFILNASLNRGKWTESGDTQFKNADLQSVDSLLDIRYQSKSYNPEFTINANYKIKSKDSRKSLSVDLDYLHNYNNQESDNRMNRLDKDQNILGIYKEFRQVSPQQTNVLSGKIEYENKRCSLFDFQTGVDFYYSSINNNDTYAITKNGVEEVDNLRSNRFEINEYTPALYLHLNKQWSEKITTAGGCRLEYTNYRGMQHTTDERIKNDYFNFLPSLYLSYHPSPHHKLNYNLSYRISRPSFRQLNPFMVYTSPVSYTKGNPFLKPEKRILHNLQYQLANKYLFTVSYDERRDVINGIQVVRENNYIESTPVNLGKQQNFKFLFNTGFRYFRDCATMDINLSYDWMKVRGEAGGLHLNYATHSLGASLNNYYQLSQKHQLSFDFGAAFSTKQKFSNVESPAYIDFNAQLRKRISNWQLAVYCNLSTYLYDGKWSQKWKLTYSTDDMKSVTYKWGEALSFGLRISYSFGNTKVQEMKKHKVSNQEIKSRVQ